MLKKVDDNMSGLQRTLRSRHMEMIALGGVIGAGLFVGSGVVVQAAGPAAVLSFALTGSARGAGDADAWRDGRSVSGASAASTNTVASPSGELAGFLTGWMYWYFWIIVVALEAVAGAQPAHLLVSGQARRGHSRLGSWCSPSRCVNLLSVRSWGEAEFWFASIKVVAIVLFLAAGRRLRGWVCGRDARRWGFGNLTSNGGFAPKGIGPVLTGAVAATGFYFGAELVTVAAAESAEPAEAVAAGYAVGDFAGAGVLRGLDLGGGHAWCPGTCPGMARAVRERAAEA